MKLSLLVVATLSVAFLSGCGGAEDDVKNAVNGAIVPKDTASATYTAVNKASGGFDLTFTLNNTGTSYYNYEIGSGVRTTTQVVDNISATYDYIIGSVYTASSIVGNSSNTLSCTPSNEETFSCHDKEYNNDALAFTIRPKKAENGTNTLFLYKCKTSGNVDVLAGYTGSKSCVKQPTTITVNGIAN